MKLLARQAPHRHFSDTAEMQVIVTVCGITKTTGYIRLGPHMPDIILVKQEMEYQLTGDQVLRQSPSK